MKTAAAAAGAHQSESSSSGSSSSDSSDFKSEMLPTFTGVKQNDSPFKEEVETQFSIQDAVSCSTALVHQSDEPPPNH